MDHAISSVREHIRATADIARDFPDDENIKKDLEALVKAINVLEQRYYGESRTSIEQFDIKK